MVATTLADIPTDIINTHILPRLDGRSLSTVTTLSSDLNTLCSNNNLWSHICMCMWPSITHPRVEAIISTFPSGHKSFFQDSFPSLITDVDHRNGSIHYLDESALPWPSQLISAVDIRYQTDIIYSTVQFTDITTEFESSEFLIKLNEDNGITKHIKEATLQHLKESVTLNWIIIDPTLKRACNLSTIKATTIKRDWVSNETFLKYVTVLPGCGTNETVQCRIQVVLGVSDKGEELHVKEVTMKLLTLDSYWLNGWGFLAVSRGAILEENNVTRKVLDDQDRCEMHTKFKEMKSKKRKLVRKEEEKKKSDTILDYIRMFALIFLSIYLLSLVSRTNVQ